MTNLISASINGLTDLANDLVLLIFLALFTVIVTVVGVWIIAANVNKPESAKPAVGKMRVSGMIAILVVLGIAVRVAFTFVTSGYLGNEPKQGMSNHGGMIDIYRAIYALFNGGGMSAVLENPNYSMYPVPFYLFAIFGKSVDLFGALSSTEITLGMQIVFRLPLILCDAAAAIVLYTIAKKYINSYAGLGMAVIYLFCPVFFFTSGVWGSTFSILALLILLSLYFMSQRNFLGLTVSYSLALLTSRDALFFIPIFGVFAVYYLIRAIKQNRAATEKLSFKALFKDKERGLIIRIPLYFICSILFMYLLQLPMLGDVNYNFFKWFYRLLLEPFAKLGYMSYNSLSIYNLFNRNAAKMVEGGIPAYVYSLLFGVLATMLVLVVYLSKKNRANMVLIAAYVVFTLSIFYMDFGVMNLIPVLVTLLLAFIIIKDKRLLHVFGLLSLAVVANACTVMMTAGYLGVYPISEYASSAGTTLMITGQTIFGAVMNLVCTAIAMLTFVYLTLIVLDIALTDSRKPFNIKGTSLGETLKDWMRVRS